MNDLKTLKPVQVDALREVANIGAGHAATALSQMTGSTIMISVPTITIAKLEDVPPQISGPEEPVAAVLMNMMGDLTGRTLLVFPKQTAVRLSELMLRRPAAGVCRVRATVGFGNCPFGALCATSGTKPPAQAVPLAPQPLVRRPPLQRGRANSA